MPPLLASVKSALVRPWLLAVVGLPLLAAAPASQPLYMPRAVKRAYAKGTRSLDGRPGAKYWQNHARYTIDVTALPPDRAIHGTERIVYVNESPDTLPRLVFKLFMNIHKPGAPRSGGASPDYLTSGVHVDSFAVNGARQPWDDSGRYFTWQPVKLPTPLAPHDSVQLAFDWHYEIAREPGREGMIDSTTYYVAYFYPRVAVYDDYNGWDTMDFTDQQEFYSDFNDYDLTVHVPANFVVWATGNLTNAAQVLRPEHLARYQASQSSDTTIRIATHAELLAKTVTASNPTNAWHFTSRYVPDVALGLSDHYDWDGGSVVVDSASHRRAGVQAAYNDTASDFRYMVQFGRHALASLSSNWPGVPYPYEKTSIFQGGAGMEYPMMVNDEAYADTSFARFVAEHEIAHTYMPFYMGINETRYGFMDEGWATTFEYLLNVANMGKDRATRFYQRFRVQGWINDPSPLEDLPIITPEDVLKNVAYGNNAYGKPSLGYLAMKDLLGDDTFRRCLHAYMDRWHGKHPIPWDFFDTFNDVSGKDLNWFWRSWYFSNGYIDLAVRGAQQTGRRYAVTVENVGGMPAPFDVVLRYADGTSSTIHETPAVWQANLSRTTVTVPAAKKVQSMTLAHAIWMDADTTNDGWPRR